MSNADREIRVGTSGWYYEHWKGVFYPGELPKSKYLTSYRRYFDTVEINNSFYHLPKKETFIHWGRDAPPGFLYAVKGSRYVTHTKRLKDAPDAVRLLVEHAELLGDHLGPILFQLPPSFGLDVGRLRDFMGVLPVGPDYAIEFRHPSWFCADVFQALAERGVAVCLHDFAGQPTPRVVTSLLVYVRFHGPGREFGGDYPDHHLCTWADWLRGDDTCGRRVFCYFNNDPGGYAVKNALRLKELLMR